MKKIGLLFVLVVFSVSMVNGQIISQYIETNSGTSPKGVEIWNNTGSTLDFSTNNLVIEKGTNGGTPSTDYTLSSDVLASDEVIVIGTSDLQTTTENNGATFYEKSFTFNGDDALVVKYGGTTIDVFGEPENDPGSGWSGNGVQTYDQNIQLKSGITSGDTDGWTDPSIRFETVSTDPVNNQSGFGIAPTGGGNIPPSISSITHTPSSGITSSTTVSVSADVTDSDGTISNVELHWGTSSGTLPNTINMSTGTKAVYTTDSDIPAQSDGTTVYYEIEATDDEPETTTSAEYSYLVNDPESLPFSESFDTSSFPTGWTFDDFTIENSNNAGGSAYEAELAFYNAVAGTSHLTSPAINTSGETELILAWNQFVDFYEGGSGSDFVIQLLTSTDGSTFSVAWSQTVTADETTLKQVTLDSSDGIGSGTLSLRWLFYQNNTNRLSYWYIDDVSLSGDSPAVIENVSHSPQDPNTSQTVSVSADVTDSDGIAGVELHWGTSSGSLGNTIDMSTSGKASYTTDSDIPAQSEGTTVYYEIYVLDDNANDTTSDEYNYYVTDATDPSSGDLIISEVCGDGADGNNNDNGFVEIYNNSGNTISLDNVQVRYYNSNPGSPSSTFDLTGVITSGEYIVITQDNTGFNNQYGFDADFAAGGDFYFNGGDDGVDIYLTTTKAEILDSFNDNGSGASPWNWNDNNDYERTSLSSGTVYTNWTEVATGTGTPGEANDNTLPVTLSTFTATFADNKALIEWTTATETNVEGFNLYRNTQHEFSTAEKINVNLIPGHGTTSDPNSYEFQDLNPVYAGTTYYYWLESVDFSATTKVYNAIQFEPEEGQGGYDNTFDTSSLSCFPNPAKNSVSIDYAIKGRPYSSPVTVNIYNILGEVVKTKEINSAQNSVDISDLTSGIFFYQIDEGGFNQIKKMVIID